MPQIPVIKTLLIDPLALAELIEAQIGYLLQPAEPGIYVRGATKPAMKANETYFQNSQGTKGMQLRHAIQLGQDITGAVFNGLGEVVLPVQAVGKVYTEPTIPVQGLKIVEAVVDKTIHDNSAWVRGTGSDIMTLFYDFIRPEYRYRDQYTRSPREAQAFKEKEMELAEHINGLLFDFRGEIVEFIGENKWIMHFKRMLRNNIVVEKTIDYRIHQWTLEHGHEYREQRR